MRTPTQPLRLAVCAVAFVALPCVVPAPASASLVITEIMYNPDSGEIPNGIAEWVEIYNSGNTVVDISGWKLSDEDGATDGVAAGTLLNPYEVLVLVSSQQTLAEFQTAWGSGFRAIQLGNWIGTGSLANDPSPTNEILTLRDAADSIIDTVNYDDAFGWPSDSPDGPSIYLLPGFLNTTDNDLGSSWARSVIGVHGGYQNTMTSVYDGADIGSPGFVAGAVPEPATFVVWSMLGVSAAGAGCWRRRRKK